MRAPTLQRRKGKYTVNQLDKMINNEGYVPVASGAELDALRDATTQTMGAGTRWEGSYATGVNGKKYVQIEHITVPAGFTLIDAFENNIYDGNRLRITNNYGFLFLDYGGEYKNIRIVGETTTARSLFLQKQSGSTANTIISDSYVNGTINTSGNKVGLFVSGNYSSYTITIQNCVAKGTITGNDSVGGFIGDTDGTIIIKNSKSFVDIQGGNYIGGFVGNHDAGILQIENSIYKGDIDSNAVQLGGLVGLYNTGGVGGYACNCATFGSIEGGSGCSLIGGIVGHNRFGKLAIENCYSHMNVNGTGTHIGGILGWQRTSGNITNSYSTGLVNGGVAGANIGGLIGQNDGVVSNSYWDTETSGQPTSDGGVGKTTAEMKAGTPSVDIYTGWDTDIWDFLTENDYPILKTIKKKWQE